MSSNVSIFHLVVEDNVGLSYARNRGAKEADGQWLAYIDDDVLLKENYVQRALETINNYDFDCFGGRYYAKYIDGKPKWIGDDFETMVPPRNDVGYITEVGLVGMNFLIKKDVLEKVGGFNVELGMNGGKVGYGEEDELQQRLLKLGYKLGFDPELVVENVILPHKLKFSWHLRSWYAHGRDGQRFSKEYNLREIAWLFTRSLVGGMVKTPACLGKWVFKRDYYWQNLVWDIISPVLYRLGQIKGAFS